MKYLSLFKANHSHSKVNSFSKITRNLEIYSSQGSHGIVMLTRPKMQGQCQGQSQGQGQGLTSLLSPDVTSRSSSSISTVLHSYPDPTYMKYYTVTHVSHKKTVQNYFRQNFAKFPPTLITFGTKMANRLKLCEVYSFSTSPNSRTAKNSLLVRPLYRRL